MQTKGFRVSVGNLASVFKTNMMWPLRSVHGLPATFSPAEFQPLFSAPGTHQPHGSFLLSMTVTWWASESR